MPIITEPAEDSSAVRAFTTYLNYLDAYRRSIRDLHGDWAGFLQASLVATRRVQGKRTNEAWVERYLPIAWNTEFLIHQAPKNDPSLLRIANHWLPVQAYYALYCAAEALGAVLDSVPPDGHRPTLRVVTEFMSKCGPAPWNITADGALGKSGNGSQIRNLAPGTRVPHNLSRRAEPLGMLAKCLKSEHRNRRDDDFRGREHHRCYKYEYAPTPTGFLHFMYRLRIKRTIRMLIYFWLPLKTPM